eukprot:4153845-Amphidinium_carterae.1
MSFCTTNKLRQPNREDDKTSSTGNIKVSDQIPAAENEDVVTCSIGKVFGVPNLHLGTTRVACNLSLAHADLSLQELQARILDDEACEGSAFPPNLLSAHCSQFARHECSGRHEGGGAYG